LLAVKSGQLILDNSLEHDMPQVFVETNWLHDFAAPAHRKVPDAVTLLERARRGEFLLHIPNISFAEARHSIQAKGQPVDGPAIHRYVQWAQKNGEFNEGRATYAHQLTEKYVNSISMELTAVPSVFKGGGWPLMRQHVCF
jgi:hypothetical protein